MNYYDEVNSYVKKVEIGIAIRETNEYNKGYDYGNLARFRKLYLCFPILGPVGPILT